MTLITPLEQKYVRLDDLNPVPSLHNLTVLLSGSQLILFFMYAY